MFEESRTEFMLKWHLCRRWRWPRPRPARLAELTFYRMIDAQPKGGIFVDLGANVGNVTAQALKHGLRVFAFEPDPTALATLQSRFGSDPNLTIIPKAVGSKSRTATFFRRPDVGQGKATQSSSLNSTAEHAGGEPIEVEVVDIIEFLRGIPSPPIIKMDIEGAEAECLEAIVDAGLHKWVRGMLVETHERLMPQIKPQLDRVRERLAADGASHVNLDWA